ncbi:MAG: hypothetical protein D6722_01650 [Bacteroidetes bacterium]|nr:MAG: hypothetical protein D6722_01650 [Bacteroidota bacterium]
MLTAVSLLLTTAQAWAQCSQCKAAAASTGADGELVVGGSINTGVLYLLSLPLILILVTGTSWYLIARQKRLAEASAQ